MLKKIGVVLIVVLVFGISSVSAGGPRNFRAHLSGDTLAQGQAIFQVSADGTAISYKLIMANVDDISMAHIHLITSTGAPPVVWLYPDAPPPQPIPGRFQGVLAQGVFTADDLVGPLAGMTLDDLITAIEDGQTFVNVHTASFPGGEARGTIK